jgi:sigma-B regulation protein RsbU (phosphoserine phosphatase)
MLELLGTVTRSQLRLWEVHDGRMRVLCGAPPTWALQPPLAEGPVETPEGPSWFAAVPDHPALWLEVRGEGRQAGTPRAALVAPLLELVLSTERDAARLWDELTVRYAEIDLLYAISEILGQTVRLEEAARTILRQVSRVVRARRASLMVFDEESGVLRVVAAQGFDQQQAAPVPVDHAHSIAARVFREQRVLAGEVPTSSRRGRGRHPGYAGRAYLSVPVCYTAPGAPSRCIGVINLTDSLDGDRFSPRDRKLVAAVAHQIGAAIENARLAAREREQQRLQDELDLAHDLQLKLMPDPAVLRGEAQVGVRSVPMAGVGGDFYTFLSLGEGRVGVMVGDVSSHGISAALVMALILSAAGIHLASARGPAEALSKLRGSLLGKLSETEMYASVCYAVVDRRAGTLTFANLGHPHAFLLRGGGEAPHTASVPLRLEATAPPLGLGRGAPIGQQTVPWNDRSDLLCLWTDGLVDTAAPDGSRFGEERLLQQIAALRAHPPQEIVDRVIAEVERVGTPPADDRTLLVMRG